MFLECARTAKAPKTMGLVAQRLLELAASEREGFKAVVANLDQERRAFLEEVLKRNVVAPQGTGVRGPGTVPSIELKMNFGA